MEESLNYSQSSGGFSIKKKVSGYHALMAKYKCPYCKRNSIEVIASSGFGATSFFFCNFLDCAQLIATGPATSLPGLNSKGGFFQKSVNKQIEEIDNKVEKLEKKKEKDPQKGEYYDIEMKKLREQRVDLKTAHELETFDAKIAHHQALLMKVDDKEKVEVEKKIEELEKEADKTAVDIEKPTIRDSPGGNQDSQSGGGKTTYQNIMENKKFLGGTTGSVLNQLKCGEKRGKILYDVQRGFFKGMTFYYCENTMELLAVGPAMSGLGIAATGLFGMTAGGIAAGAAAVGSMGGLAAALGTSAGASSVANAAALGAYATGAALSVNVGNSIDNQAERKSGGGKSRRMKTRRVGGGNKSKRKGSKKYKRSKRFKRR